MLAAVATCIKGTACRAAVVDQDEGPGILASWGLAWFAGDGDAVAGSSFARGSRGGGRGCGGGRRCRAPSSRLVSPSALQGMRWWASHQAVGRVQPSAAQRKLCRTAIARRCGLLCRRRRRPWSRISDFPPRTIGMTPAAQAMRRASPGERSQPVSMVAAWSPPRRVSRVMVTTTLAFSPPLVGSGVRVEGLDEAAERLTQHLGDRPRRERPHAVVARELRPRCLHPCRSGAVGGCG